MRRSPLLVLIFAAVALAAGGCGGGEVSVEEVPGAPPALVVPTDSELGAGGGSSSDESTSGTDEGADAGAGADSGRAAGGTADAPADASGGTTAPAPEATAAPDDTTTQPEQPPAGSAPEQFESFCEQNAGAC
jgi:hypothetical protein